MKLQEFVLQLVLLMVELLRSPQPLASIALKGEAMGLAMIYELPLVIVNIQRGGPSTGLPTKTEQSDLLQCMYGRNGESPMIVVAASKPSDCFEMAFEASRLSLEHMTPVVLLTDGYIANGSEPWKIPDLSKEFTKKLLLVLLIVSALRLKVISHMQETNILHVLGQSQNDGF